MTTSNLFSDIQQASPIVFITGGAVRIGRHIALTMAKAGWDVAIHYRYSEDAVCDVVAEIIAFGQRAIALQADLSDHHAVEQLVPQVIRAFGSIQCIVNNAALFEEDHVANFDPKRLAHHIEVNTTAPILLARALFNHTPRYQQACVINLLDQKLDNLNPDFLSYTLSKSALACATITLAQSLAPKVRVVGVSPGVTLPSRYQSAKNFTRSHQATPLGYASSPEDIAQAILYLATAKAVTGEILTVDGGQHLLGLPRDIMYYVRS